MDIVISTLLMLGRGIPGLVAAGVALLLMLLALVRREPGLMVLAALLTIPSAYVLGSWTGLLLAVRLIPLFSFASAYFIAQEDPIFMWGLSVPSFLFLGYFVFNIVINNFTGV